MLSSVSHPSKFSISVHYCNDCSQKVPILQLILVFSQSHKSDIPDKGPIYMLRI